MRETLDERATISDLLHQHRDKTGDSYADIAKKTGLSKSLVGRLFTKTSSHLVQRDTVDKLSHGLGIPLHVVERAALETGHIDYRAPDRIKHREALLLNRYSALPPELQDALIEIAGTLGKVPDLRDRG